VSRRWLTRCFHIPSAFQWRPCCSCCNVHEKSDYISSKLSVKSHFVTCLIPYASRNIPISPEMSVWMVGLPIPGLHNSPQVKENLRHRTKELMHIWKKSPNSKFTQSRHLTLIAERLHLYWQKETKILRASLPVSQSP
jgi:hypothetical protein